MKLFLITNIQNFDASTCLNEDELHGYFSERLGEADANRIVEWAAGARRHDELDLYPAAPYMIEAR